MKAEEIEIMRKIEKGATVWGIVDAKAIRELQKDHPNWLDIISNLEELEGITGEKYDGTKRCPYFGAILKGDGKRALADAKLEKNVAVALTGLNDNRAYYTFSGDLEQMGTIERTLREEGFNVVKSNVYPGFPENEKEEYVRALKYLWEHRVHGWWNQKQAFIDNGICSLEEFNKVLGR